MIYILIFILLLIIYYNPSFNLTKECFIIYYGRKKRKEIIWQIK